MPALRHGSRPSPGRGDRRAPTVRIVTWNIHGCVGADGRRNRDRTVGVLARLAPDVIALQEVDSRARGALDTFELLCRRLGRYHVEAPTLHRDGGRYGQMLISRWPMSATRVHDVSERLREPRRVIDAQVDLRGVRLRVIAAHLGLARLERRRQIQRIGALALEAPETPTVLLGDFNEWIPFGYGRRVLGRLFGRTRAHATFPSRLPLLPLDRIWVRPSSLLAATRVASEAGAASDHLPLVAELVWPSPDGRATDPRRGTRGSAGLCCRRDSEERENHAVAAGHPGVSHRRRCHAW